MTDSKTIIARAIAETVREMNPKEVPWRVDFEQAQAAISALSAAGYEIEGEELYLVWSNEHRAWWRPNSRGYTADVRKAGLYPKSEAIYISHKGRDGWGGEDHYGPMAKPDEIAVPLSVIPEEFWPKAMIGAGK